MELTLSLKFRRIDFSEIEFTRLPNFCQLYFINVESEKLL